MAGVGGLVEVQVTDADREMLANILHSTTTPGLNVTDRPREGVVFNKWPFRLDIAKEYQDWILVGACFFIVAIWCLPCFCGRLQAPCSRRFTSWVYTRLHQFYCFVIYFTLLVMMSTIGVLPDWTVNEFLQYLGLFVAWVLVHLQKLITSFAILFGFFLMLKFRDRVLLASGIEHITFFRFGIKDLIGGGRQRPVEIFFWKVDGLQSSGAKVLKSNDVYVECHMGYNEPMRTRVHNNAGTSCHIHESIQLNIDESQASTLMTVLVKDQTLLASSELGRLMLSTRELCGIEDQTGKRRHVEYSEDCFVALDLNPRGRIWIAVAPVMDADDEQAPLVQEDSLLMTC